MAERVEAVAAKIVRAGYRALSLKNHPDIAGGSHDAMIALTAARDFLARLLQGGGQERSGLADFFDEMFRTSPRARTWADEEAAQRQRQSQAQREARWREEERAERQQQEEVRQARARVRINRVWTEVDAVFAANQSPRALCCQIPGFRKPFWVGMTQIAPDSLVRKAGDRGTLKVKTAFARQAGIIDPDPQ